MKNLLLLLSAIMVISCSNELPEQNHRQPVAVELVDIRIFPEGKVRFNGKMIRESGLKSHIEALNTSTSTRARIIFDERAYTQLIFHTMELLHENHITNIHSKVLSPQEFQVYNKHKIHIDILNTGEILFQGDKMHPNNLPTALKNIDVNSETEFIISVGKKAKFGPVLDVQKALVANNQMNISTEDISKYEH